MSEETTFEISIPSDNEGYILLQCGHCGTFFKITEDDTRDDRILNVYCPCCGLISDNYFTEDVIELAQALIQNYAMDYLFNAVEELERKTKKGAVRFEAGHRPKHERENPIKSGIDALELASFDCCGRSAKIQLLLKMTGCYCPFCGVKNYEIE